MTCRVCEIRLRVGGFAAARSGANVVSEVEIKSIWSTTWASAVDPRAYLYPAVLIKFRVHHRGTRLSLSSFPLVTLVVLSALPSRPFLFAFSLVAVVLFLAFPLVTLCPFSV